MAHVLRIPTQDASFVLVNVAPTNSGPSLPLDVTLIGTEGTAPYVLNLKHNRASSLKAKNSPCSEEEWETILESVILGKNPDEAEKLLHGVEAIAEVEEEKDIKVLVRKRVGSITQRLGSFQLSHDESQVIELFDWCGTAVEATGSVTQELFSLKTAFHNQQEIAAKLEAQIEDLIKAKADYEKELVEKFRLLLNEKKSKIRDQARLLAASNVNHGKLAGMETSQIERSHRAGVSRSGKRKEPSDDGSDDGFEKMDVDEDDPAKGSDVEGATTPEPENDETADEDDEPVAPAPARNTRLATAEAKRKGKGMRKSNEDVVQPQQGLDDRAITPPRRELPFANKKLAPKKVTPPLLEDDGEETEDDEL